MIYYTINYLYSFERGVYKAISGVVLNLIMKARASAKRLICFLCMDIWMKTNFQSKNCARSLAFMRFRRIRKWPIRKIFYLAIDHSKQTAGVYVAFPPTLPHDFFDTKHVHMLKKSPVSHFPVVCLVTWPLSASEAGVDFDCIKTSVLFKCKCKYFMIRTTWLRSEKQWGLYQADITSLASTQRLGN